MTMEDREAREARELAIEKEYKGPAVTETMLDDYQYPTKPGRSVSHNVGAVAIDILIALTSAYFIVFAALAHAWDERPATDFSSLALLRAAKWVS